MSITPNKTGYCILSLFLFFNSFSISHHVHAAANSSNICNLTPHPNFCLSQQQGQNKSSAADINDSGRLFLAKSLAKSKTLLLSINRYLADHNSQSTTFALKDCAFLLTSNVDMLSTIALSLKNTNTLQTFSEYEDFETQLSAVLTNQETCLEGLTMASASSIIDDISPSISDGTMLCSISLAFFKNGWMVPRRRQDSSSLPFHRRLLQVIGGAQINKTVIVNPDGSGNYTTIGDAIAAAPNNTKVGKGYYQIRVVAGVYQEYINIASNKKYLMIVGDGINQTIITGNRSVDDGWSTFDCGTFIVTGAGFVGVNFTVQNTAGAIKHQAVALRSGADLSAFYKCSFEGYQDTLYTHSMRQFYRECDIYGTVDYIFGNAAVVLQQCNLYSRLPLQGQFNALTAQGKTDINQNTGTSIHNCTIKAADDLASSNGTTKTYLGRPWKTYSTTVYMESSMDALIAPSGWSPWSGNQSLDTLYYAEYNNTGPGSNTSNRVTWIGYHIITNGSGVSNFTVSNFIAGDAWLPSTGVPYAGGLLYYP